MNRILCKTYLVFIVLFCGSLLATTVKAQGTETCVGAPNIANITESGSLTGAVDEGALSSNPGCGNGTNVRTCTGGFSPSSNYEDIWYTIDNSGGAGEITVNINGLTGAEEVILFLYDGGCTNGDMLEHGNTMNSVTDNPTGSPFQGNCAVFDSGNTSFEFTNLASISDIKVRVMPYVNASDCTGLVNASAFTINAVVPQPNDVCANATNITVNNLIDTGITTTNNIGSSTDENNSIDCTAAAVTAGDVWYEVLYPDVPSVIQDFYTELSLTGTAGETVRVIVYDVTSACGSAGDIADVDYCEDITLTGGTDITTIGDIASSDGFSRYVQIIPVGSVGDVTVSATVVNENNACSHFQNSLPGYDITGAQPVDFNYSTDSGADPLTAGNDLWYQFSPTTGSDGFNTIYSTSADIIVSGLNAGEEITFILYKGNTVSANNCIDLSADYLSTITVDADGTVNEGLSCLDEWHGPADGGYLLRIVQTAGATTASPTVTISPNAPGPSNNTCANIWDGSGAAIGPNGNPNSDVAHDWNQFLILNGETVSGTFVGANDCENSGFCNAVDYAAIEEVNDRDAWYVFTVPDNQCASLGLTQSTVLYSMDLTYDAGNAFRDGIMYVYSDCGDGNLIDCSAALDGEGETWTVNGLTQGQSYLLRVKPWDISQTPTDWTFDITVNEGDPAPCNDNADNAEGLLVNACSNYASLPTWSAQGATESAPVDGAPETDVWFSFTAPDPANGGTYTTEKSWVTVFFEAVSGETLWLELYNTQSTEGGSLMEYTASGAGDQAFAQFGNLNPGQTYWLRMYHKQLATVDVQYKIEITTGAAIEPGVACGQNSLASLSECSGPCADLREQWFKIDLPDNTPGNSYWMIEVMGYDEYLDFELRSKYLMGVSDYVDCDGTEGVGEGSCADFDHPCSSRILEPAVSISSTTQLMTGGDGLTTGQSCDDGMTASPNEGRGVRRVYFNMNGAVSGQKDYYYLRVFMDPSSPNYATSDDVFICQLNFFGPYTSQADAEAGDVPNGGDCLTPLDCASDNGEWND